MEQEYSFCSIHDDVLMMYEVEMKANETLNPQETSRMGKEEDHYQRPQWIHEEMELSKK